MVRWNQRWCGWNICNLTKQEELLQYLSKTRGIVLKAIKVTIIGIILKYFSAADHSNLVSLVLCFNLFTMANVFINSILCQVGTHGGLKGGGVLIRVGKRGRGWKKIQK